MNEHAADLAVAFFETCLRFTKGRQFAGQPFVPLPWQADEVIRPTFGNLDDEGRRVVQEVFLGVPRKQGKTELLAGIGCRQTTADNQGTAPGVRPCGEIYSAAATRSQAGISFTAGKRMVETSPILRKRCTVMQHSIESAATGNTWRPLSADVKGHHGYSPSTNLIDELHMHANRDLADVLTSGMGSRDQPLTVYASTAGFDTNSICFEIWEYARKVRDGDVVDPTFLPVLYETPDNAPWDDEDVWRACTPSLGHTVQLEFLRRECRKAKESPAAQNTFRRLYLNQWTAQQTRWLDMDVWKRNAYTADLRALLGNVCYAAVDLSSTTDYTALALVFPMPDGTYKLFAWFWIPEQRLVERQLKDRVPVAQWKRDGLLTTTPGGTVDYGFIRKQLNELNDRYRVVEVAIDRWNAGGLQNELDQDGFTVVPFGQGYASMSDPSKQFEKLLLEDRMHHGGNPVLQWMASCVAVSQDAAGNIKPDKAKSGGSAGLKRIDGIVAAIMATGRAVLDEGGSVYHKRGLQTV